MLLNRRAEEKTVGYAESMTRRWSRQDHRVLAHGQDMYWHMNKADSNWPSSSGPSPCTR